MTSSTSHGYRWATMGMLTVTALAFIAALPGSLSLLMLVAPAYWFTCRIDAEDWERWAMAPIFSFLLASFLSYALAVFIHYSATLAWFIFIALNLLSIADLIRHPPSRPPSTHDERLTIWEKVQIAAVLVPVVLIFFYGVACPAPGFNNGLLPGYGQMGLFIRRTGDFHLLLSSEACYDNSAFLYMPGYPGLIAWMASAASFEALRRALGFVAPYVVVSGFGVMLALGYRRGWKLSTSLLTLLLILPSYALFKISYEIESDNPAIALIGVYLYLMNRLTEEREKKDAVALWIGVALLWSFSWWVRPYLGIFLTFTTAGLLLLSTHARRTFLPLFKPGRWPWVRPLRLTAVVSVVLWGFFWEGLLWVHTGSPLAPRSVTAAMFKVATIKPEFSFYEPGRRQDSAATAVKTPAASDDEEMTTGDLVVYHFFPMTNSGSMASRLFKSARGLVHGNSFSLLFSVLTLIGSLFSFRGVFRRGIFSRDGVPLMLFSSVLILTVLTFFHPKIFLSVTPIFFCFAGDVVARTERLKAGPWVALLFSGFLAMVFTLSFFWSGIGTWPADRRWAIFKAGLRTPEAREWIKNGDVLKPVIDVLKTAPKDERFLFFHPEPGQGLAFDLDHHMFWEDYHYNSRRLAALHRSERPDQVIRALQALGIRHIVLTYGLAQYLNFAEPEVLPRMLINGDPRLILETQSTGGVYRIYRVEPAANSGSTGALAPNTAMLMGLSGPAKT